MKDQSSLKIIHPQFFWTHACISYFLGSQKRGIPEGFSFCLALTSLKLLSLPLVQWLPLGLCVKYATLMSQRCALSALACSPFPHAPEVPFQCPPCTTKPQIPPPTGLVVVGAVAWTKLNPPEAFGQLRGQHRKKSE